MREVNTHKIIRIFLASSIDDTKEERDKLQNKILAVWNPIFNKFNINIFFSSCFRLLFPYTAAIGARFCKVKEIFIFFL